MKQSLKKEGLFKEEKTLGDVSPNALVKLVVLKII